MSQQQLQLRLLEQEHLKKLIQLNKQRMMLDNQNPYKNQFNRLSHTKTHSIDPSRLPLLRPDPNTQRLLYGQSNKIIDRAVSRKNPPSKGEAQIAESCIRSLVDRWHSETYYIPKDIHFQHIQRQKNVCISQKQLTPAGREDIQQILEYSRMNDKTRKKQTIKQKYSIRSVIPQLPSSNQNLKVHSFI